MTDLNRLTLDQAMSALDRMGVDYELIGPPRAIQRVCSLLNREPNGLYYYSGKDPSVIGTLTGSVVICDRSIAVPTDSCSCIAVTEDPQVVFYRLCGALFDTRPAPGIHPTAIVHPEAVIGEQVHIGPYAVIGRSSIGSGSIIHAHVVILDGCTIGQRVVIEPNSCIGATGAVWIWGNEKERLTLPQLGGVSIGDDVFMSADVSVVRGLLNEDTIIGRGSVIAPGSKIGHSVVLEEDVHLANNVSIAGSARIGARSFLGSGCAIRSHTRLAPDTIVGLGAAVVRDVVRSGVTVAGVPAAELEDKAQRKGVPRPRG
jgi:UDP-3-O-[3-hydroxymyristoyl] glucosamine N-acyltransferase